LFLLLIANPAYSQICPGNAATLSIGNFQATSTTIEWDVYITFTSSSVTNKFSGYGGNIIYGSGLLPAGATGTFSVVDQPNSAQFPGIAASTVTPTHNVAARSLRWTYLPLISPVGSAPLMAANTQIKFARMRFTCSLAWTASSGSLAFNHLSAGGNPLNIITTYCNTNNASGSISLANSTLTLATGQTQNTPFTYSLLTGPTAAAASNLVAESPCAGAANGSALITLTGAPSATSAVTYTVDGGATQNATLSSSAFTVCAAVVTISISSIVYVKITEDVYLSIDQHFHKKIFFRFV
jgi:hypothetical protein